MIAFILLDSTIYLAARRSIPFVFVRNVIGHNIWFCLLIWLAGCLHLFLPVRYDFIPAYLGRLGAGLASGEIRSADLVRLPNGQPIGFRARHAELLKGPIVTVAQSE
jgi:hypothetical protein